MAVAVDEEHSERSPLLEPVGGESEQTSNLYPHAYSPTVIVILLCIVIFFINLSASLLTVPQVRVLESILCRRHYGKDVEERLCKIGAIQSQVAYLNGVMDSVQAVAGIVVAFPYGILADKIGRRPVFMLGVIGLTLQISWILIVLRFPATIPLFTITLAPLFQLVGGGPLVMVAVIFTIVADVEKEANRASAFFRMSLASLISQLIGPVISSKLMEVCTPWVPLLLTVISFPVASTLLLFIPETLDSVTKERSGTSSPTDSTSLSALESMKAHLRHSFQVSLSSVTHLRNPNIVLLLLPFLVNASLVPARAQFLIQYVSLRFDWSLASAGYLLSLQGIVNILLFLVLLPVLSALLTSPKYNFGYQPAKKDFVLLLVSVLILVLGLALQSLPVFALVVLGIALVALGSGLPPLCRSLVTSFVDKQHTTQLYTLIGIVEAAGMLYAGPALAWCLSKGMDLGGGWLGLPYFWLTGCTAVMGVALAFVRVKGVEQVDEDGSILE